MTASNNLEELKDWLVGSFEQFLRSDPTATTSASAHMATEHAMLLIARLTPQSERGET